MRLAFDHCTTAASLSITREIVRVGQALGRTMKFALRKPRTYSEVKAAAINHSDHLIRRPGGKPGRAFGD